MPNPARSRKPILASLFVLIFFLAAGGVWLIFHASKSPGPDGPNTLASFTENGVEVTIRLEQDVQGKDILAATFTPIEPGLHLYSKDIPPDGIDGLGRPTLLELPAGSKMQASGGLKESVAPLDEPVQIDYPELRAYPEGPVTLSLEVKLPQEAGNITDSVSVTYMACSQKGCRPPVEGKVVAVRYRTNAP